MALMRYLYWASRTLILLGACALGCSSSSPPSDIVRQPVSVDDIIVVRAKLQPWPKTIRLQGSLLAYEDAVIGTKLAGRVASVNVDLGSVVRLGETLVKLVQSELELRVGLAEAQLRQACAAIGITPAEDENLFDAEMAPGVAMEQALVSEAQSTVNRAQKLLNSRAVTEQEYDTMVAQLKAAQARYNSALNLVGEQISMIGVRRKELALAKQMVSDSQIVAPFNGVVGERLVSPGEFVGAGQAVVSLVRADLLRFTAGVPESHAGEIKIGQKVKIIPGFNIPAPITATIVRISPTVLQATRSIKIEADVPNPLLVLQAGLFAEAEVVIDPDSEALALPLTAVSRFAGVQKVWVVADGIASQRTIRTGRENGRQIEILEGIDSGDLVVLNAQDGHDGPVVPQEQPSGSLPQAQAPASSSAAICRTPDGTN